jgi:hypothetical protein
MLARSERLSPSLQHAGRCARRDLHHGTGNALHEHAARSDGYVALLDGHARRVRLE